MNRVVGFVTLATRLTATAMLVVSGLALSACGDGDAQPSQPNATEGRPSAPAKGGSVVEIWGDMHSKDTLEFKPDGTVQRSSGPTSRPVTYEVSGNNVTVREGSMRRPFTLSGDRLTTESGGTMTYVRVAPTQFFGAFRKQVKSGVLELAFSRDGAVKIKTTAITSSGATENEFDATYTLTGDQLSIKCPGGDATMTRTDDGMSGDWEQLAKNCIAAR